MTPYRSDYQIKYLLQLHQKFSAVANCDVISFAVYNYITHKPLLQQHKTTGSHILTCRSPLQEKQVLFFMLFVSRRF